MSDKTPEKEPSYGKIMTSLLIPKDLRTNPRRILSGVAFIALVSFFLFAALSKSCQRDQLAEVNSTSGFSIETTKFD